MTVKDLREVIHENYYQQISLIEEDSYYSLKKFRKENSIILTTKFMEKIQDPSNAKESYDLFFKNKA